MTDLGMITCNYFMRIYDYKEPADFDWMEMSNKWKTEFGRDDFLQLAKEIYNLGYSSIEIWEPHFSYTMHTEEEAKEMASALREIGFRRIAYCIGGWGKADIDVVDKAYAFAKALGAKVVTGCIQKPDIEVILPVVEAAGKKHGIVYAIENHPSPNLESPEEIAEAMKSYETIGANLDTGIYNMQGYDVLKAMDTLKGKIFHSHFKDTVKGGEGCLPIGDGDAPMIGVYKRFQEEGYTGMVSVEFEFPEDPAPGLKKSIDYIKTNMA